MHLSTYLALLDSSLETLSDAYAQVAQAHGEEPDVAILCAQLADKTRSQREALGQFVARYGEEHGEAEPDRLRSDLFQGTRSGGVGLLRDLQDLYLLATLADITWTLVGQAAQGARDRALHKTVAECESQTSAQLKWLKTRMKSAAPQALLVAS